MRDGVQLFTAVYVPKDTKERYPIMLSRTPYSVQPYGVDAYKSNLGPSPLFGTEGYIVVYQDVRGRWMSEGEFVNMRPHRPQKSSPTDIDESTDTFDTIDWLMKHVPNHNGRVGMWGISYPGFYTAAGMIDAHPALKAASPQAPVTDWFTGDDWHHNGAFQLPHAFNFLASFGHPRPEPTKKSADRFDHGTPDGYAFFLEARAALERQHAVLQERRPVLERDHAARHVRPVLARAKPAPASEEHQAGRHDRRRLVRRREPVRCPRDLQERRGHEPRRDQRAGDGALEPRRLEPLRRRQSWARSRFPPRPREFYREHIEFPFFQYYLKGKGIAQLSRSVGLRDGHEPVENLRRLAAAHRPAPLALPATAAAASRSSRPQNRPSPAFDEYVSDPAHPVEYIDQIEIRMTGDYMIQDQRVAVAPARRAGLRERAASTDDVTIAGPIQARMFVSTSGTDSDWVVKLIDVYPDDFPTARCRSAGREIRRLPAARPRRRDARQVSQQPGETRAVRAQPADARQLHAPGRRPHVPDRPQDHGPGPEHLVPADRPQPAKIRRYLQRDRGRLSESHPARLPQGEMPSHLEVLEVLR